MLAEKINSQNDDSKNTPIQFLKTIKYLNFPKNEKNLQAYV